MHFLSHVGHWRLECVLQCHSWTGTSERWHANQSASASCWAQLTIHERQNWEDDLDIFGYGSIPINTIFRGMNIHLPAILMFTRGTRFWHTAIYLDDDWRCLALWQSDDQNCWKLRWWAACTSWAWTSATAMVRTRLAWVSHGTKALNPPRHWSGSMGFKWFPTAGANSLLPAAESSSPYTGLQDRVEQATPARQKKSASCRTLGE